MLKIDFGKLVTAAFLGTALLAQSPSEKQIRDKFVNEDRAAARKDLKMPPAPLKVNSPDKKIERFSAAVETYRAAVASNAALENPLKEVEQSIGDLERYFRTSGTPKVKKTAFAGLSRPELAAETLKSADRLKADLRGLLRIGEDALFLIQPDTRAYLGDLHRETLRLKFLISKTRSSR